ncbi:3'(2'),5'-bisphosphate nucleotidase CysQ [Chitinophaga sancti]|uniref:3'(2'),5'-bisphosphate nucleotidase CysQ n=1 Tax=Chitinophaga sancti TaxID=1004 RepID=UPI003F7A9256
MIQQLLAIATEAAYAAGKVILEVYGSDTFDTQQKADESPVTAADKAAHAVITNYLTPANIPILSEEATHPDYSIRTQWEYFWLVDPLDGTKEFISKNGEFTVNIALIHKNKPIAGVVYAPVLGDLYYGSEETGVYKNNHLITPLEKRRSLQELLDSSNITIIASRSHLSAETKDFIAQFSNVRLTSMGSSLKFMLLLEGKADLYPRLFPTMEWDTAAAHAILNAANRGIYHTNVKDELTYNKANLANPYFLSY